MRRKLLVCLLCVVLLIGCTEGEEAQMSEIVVTPSAVSASPSDEQYSDAPEDPVEMRKTDYEKAKTLIEEKEYKEAYSILKYLDAYRDEFPDLYDLIKKVRILSLQEQSTWTDEEGRSQIVITGKRVKVKLYYTSKSWEHKVANYTGKINAKRSTPYKIAIVHNGKVDYIHTAFHNDNDLFRGEIYYEVYNAVDEIELFTEVGLEAHNKMEEEASRKKSTETKEPEIKKPDPSIGMTASEVEESSWGKPERKNITEYAWGTKEQWVYSDRRYIYLEDGIVTSIQRSE